MPLDPTPNWPGTGLDSFPQITEFTKQNDDGYEADLLLNKHSNTLEAIEARLGSTVTNVPVRGKALIGKASDAGIWDLVARPNLLLNGSMKIAQAPMPTADNAFSLDGWRLLLGAANAFTVSQESSDVPAGGSPRAMKLTVGSGNNNKGGAWQVLESLNIRDLRGKKISARVRLKATSGIATAKLAIWEFTGTADSGTAADPISAWNAQGTAPTLAANYAYLGTPTAIVPTTTYTDYFLEGVTVGASANNIGVFVWSDDTTTTQTTDYILITDVKLEEGEVCTGVVNRSLRDSQAECERYYAKSWAPGTAVGTASANGAIVFGGSDNNTAKNIYAQVRYRQSMRTTPTVTLYDAAGNSGKITTIAAAGTTTDNVTPGTGAAFATSEGFAMTHNGAIAGVLFHYVADARL